MKRKSTKKFLYVFIMVMTLVVLTGCSIYEKGSSDTFRQIKFGKGLWDTVFVYPVAWIMNKLTSWTGFFALGVVFTTIVVRTIAFPIYTKSNDNSLKMQAIQPEIQKIQAKYVNKTDPESKQRMQLELMQVYKTNDINILAGCLMPFIQMPIFMAMYHAVARVPHTFVYNDSKMRFFWTMLDNKEMFWDKPLNLILPVLVVITSILQQQVSMIGLSAEAKNNPTMKVMMYMMPAMMFIFSVTQVQALSLYWVAGNIYSTLQVIVVKRPFNKEDNNTKSSKLVKR